jgi:hypothetical protein
MNKRILNTLAVMVGLSMFTIISCKKNNLVVDQDVVPPSFARFLRSTTTDTLTTYFIRDNNAPLKLPIGLTTVSDKPRTIQFTYTSRTAVQGAQYTAPTSLVIPAGKAVDTLTIAGIFAGYNSTRVDTLDITISTAGEVPSTSYTYQYKHRVIMRKLCDVNLNALLGDYKNTNELWGTSAYGPYTTKVLSVTPISATKGRIVVGNIFDYGWNPITFELDWTDPLNTKTTVISQTSGIADAGTLSATYAGGQVAVRPLAATPTGSFNACDQTIILNMQLGVAGVGYFANLYTVTMKR